MAEEQPSPAPEQEQVVVVVAAVTAHEHAEAAHDVGHPHTQALDIEGHGPVDVRHAEHHVVDQLGLRALVPFAVPVPAWSI